MKTLLFVVISFCVWALLPSCGSSSEKESKKEKKVTRLKIKSPNLEQKSFVGPPSNHALGGVEIMQRDAQDMKAEAEQIHLYVRELPRLCRDKEGAVAK